MFSRLRAHASCLPRRGLTFVLVSLLAVASVWGATLPASAVPPLIVTSTTTASVAPNATTTLSGLSLSGSSEVNYQVTVATKIGTLTFPQTTGLTLGYGNSWAGTSSVSFSGSAEDLNTALAAVQLVTGATAGQTTTVSVTALPTESGYVYSAPNGHFYQFVASPGVSWSSARATAQTKTFLGQQGYLATIPSSQINDLIASRIQGARNVWFGARATNASSGSVQRTWAWTDGPLSGTAITYCSNLAGSCAFVNDTGLYHNWASGEPNNSGGTERVPVTNWNGGIGKWNDLADSAISSIGGYVVEYGDQVQGATSFPGVATASSDVAIVAAPDAPADVSATRGNGSATVSFAAPADNGSAITGYTVTTTPGGATTECPGSPCLIEGLDNGTEYTFTVTATNGEGTSDASEPSGVVVPATVPGAPDEVAVTGGDKSATVTFTAPEDNGGSVVTSYTVTSAPDGHTATCPGSPCVVTGLANGTAYTFTVTANNSLGSSDPSVASESVTVRGVPGAPTDASATADNGTATVSFTAPEDDGGAEITGYVVTSEPDGLTATCDDTPCVVTGLTNGTAYTFTVQALNVVGRSEGSSPTDEVTPVTVPTGPRDLTVTRGDTSAELTFEAPADNGGARITRYQVSTDDGDTWVDLDTTGESPLTATVTGLENGTEYRIAVRAVNRAGEGPATELSNVTPAGVPETPTDVTATRGDQQVSVAFTAPSDNGSPITGYTVVVAPGGRTVACEASPCTVDGLDNGTAYRFSVYATNDVGDSDKSESTDPVNPATTPGAPNLQSVVSVARGLIVHLTAPSTDGGDDIHGYEISLDGGDTWVTLPVTLGDDDLLTGTVTGLDNGTEYVVRVRAVNAVGGGEASGKISSTVATTPSAPRRVEVSVADGEAVVKWRAPESDGGSAIVRYEVTAEPGGEVCRSTTLLCTFTDLTPGTTYTFSVVADNTYDGRNGTGRSEAGVSDEVLITDVPSAPVGLSVTPGDRTISLAFGTPYNEGGRPITEYQVSLDGGKSWKTLHTDALTTEGLKGIVSACRVADDRALHVSGGCGAELSGKVEAVLNGSTYAVSVRAVNSNGSGDATSDVPVTPMMWFADQVSNTDRAAEIAVPTNPSKYKGGLKHTTAYYRSKNRTVAYPAALLDGRQLQQEQSVLVKGSYFAKKKTTLNSTGKKEVKAMAASLTYVSAVTCEGYAGYGGNKTHAAEFSRARAATVCAAIDKYAKSVSSRKTVGYGAAVPMVVGGKSSDRDVNRRVVVLIRASTPIKG